MAWRNGSLFRPAAVSQQDAPRLERQTDALTVAIGGTLQYLSESLSKRLTKCLHLKTDPSQPRPGSVEIAFLT